MAHVTIGKIRPQRDEFEMKGVAVSDSEFFESKAKQADDVIHFKRLVIDLTGHHGDRTSPLTLIVSLRANLCTLSAPEDSCVGASVAVAIIHRLVQRCYVDPSGGRLLPRAFNELSHKEPDALTFAVEDAYRVAAILHDARQNGGGISEKGYFLEGKPAPQYW